MRLYSDASHDDDVIGIGYIVRDEIDDIDVSGKQYVEGNFTSMEAEFTALMSGLHIASWYGDTTLVIQTDCNPLAEKMKHPDDEGKWHDNWQEFDELVSTFGTWSISSVPRSQNMEADRLAREALWFGRQEVE